MEKICSTCKELKEISNFPREKRNKDGYKGKCRSCLSKYQKEWRLNNKEHSKGYQKIYRENNKEKAKEHRLKIKESYKEYYKKYNKKYNLEHKEERRKYKRSYIESQNSKISKLIRSRILYATKLISVKKCASTNELLGCSWDFFLKYIESKFTKNMSWDNHGLYGWHLDHIRPCSSFNLSDPEQQKLCFHYTNMQPLWATTEIAIKYGEGQDYIGNIEKGGVRLKKE